MNPSFSRLPLQPHLYAATRRRAHPARPDKNVTRCTCGSWALLYQPCPACGIEEVTSIYRKGF